MQRVDHPLLSPSLGVHKTLTSFHFGQAGAEPKFYIQASLHAEELPGMLVAYHLRSLLEAAEAAGTIGGEIILVPVANPIGLAQRVDHKVMGRFELETSENFNRNYPDLAKAMTPAVRDQLGSDGITNVRLVRKAIGEFLQGWKPQTELQSLRRTLLTLSHDADRMIDLHCDCEAVMHFYTEVPCWPALESLARLLGSEAILLAKNSGGGAIDECLSGVWWQLAEALAAQGHPVPIPQGCCSTTVELRGEGDVAHAWAKEDANAILSFLQLEGAISCAPPPIVPPLKCSPTPLAGSETLKAATPGIIVFAAQVGDRMDVGDLVAEIIDPIAHTTQRITAGVAGVLYARVRERYAVAGAELGKIAGAKSFRTGDLLGA